MNSITDRFTFSIALSVALLAWFANCPAARAANPVTPTPRAQPQAQPSPSPSPAAAPANNGMKKATDLIKKQDPATTVPRVMDKATPDNTHVVVSLSKQRAYLWVHEQEGLDEVALDTPVSTGKHAGMTPTGNFTVLEKDPNHKSNIFGNFVDGKGRVVRGGISLKIDSAPSGTHYEGAPMLWFMRLTDEGVGMHVGILPGYPASHGCVRMPADIAPLIYQKVKVGTPVEIDP
ncbi:MAG TPA: L,D-transpeptidase family protein [Chthoniobacteraceae bacterium]|nr:L,D-transpeptidase family protein [Chthoniobacteraceae bacterium]